MDASQVPARRPPVQPAAPQPARTQSRTFLSRSDSAPAPAPAGVDWPAMVTSPAVPQQRQQQDKSVLSKKSAKRAPAKNEAKAPRAAGVDEARDEEFQIIGSEERDERARFFVVGFPRSVLLAGTGARSPLEMVRIAGQQADGLKRARAAEQASSSCATSAQLDSGRSRDAEEAVENDAGSPTAEHSQSTPPRRAWGVLDLAARAGATVFSAAVQAVLPVELPVPAEVDVEAERRRRARIQQEKQQDKLVTDLVMSNSPPRLAYCYLARDAEAKSWQAHAEEQSSRAMALVREKEGLNAALAQSEKKVGELSQELASSRAFVELEDAGDVNEVVQGIADLNEAIEDLVHELLSGLECDGPLTREMVCAVRGSEHESVKKRRALAVEVWHAGQKGDGATVYDLLEPAFSAIICAYLAQHVFAPFKVGLDQGSGQVLSSMLQVIRATEPQDRSARWRSITYARCRPSDPNSDRAFASSTSSSILLDLLLLTSTLYGVPIQSLDFSPLDKTLSELVLAAIKWRHKTRESHLSYEYEPVWSDATPRPPGARPAKADIVLAVKGFGLVQSRSVAVQGGAIRAETKVLVATKQTTLASLQA
ncbi:hypothetical protein JCM5296_005383 [Sporobolomyces johnsonii]